MLRYWNHPRADESSFRAGLLEAAAEVLHSSAAGERLFDELDPQNVNFVAAIWHAESVSLMAAGEMSQVERESREKWLNSLLKAVPSCFCNPDLLK